MNPMAMIFLLLGGLGGLMGAGGGGSKAAKASPPPPVDPVDPIDPVDPVDPVDPPDPIDPVDPNPTPPPQTGGTGEDGGAIGTTTLEGTVGVMTGRVTTLELPGDDIASVRVMNGPDAGHVSVNPDNTFALVMTQSDYTGTESFTYEVTHDDGSTSQHQANLNVTAGTPEGGWGTGESHYMLETDENDKVVVEHGDEHRKVFVSGSDDALTIADIAALEDINVGFIDGKWLAGHPEYGASEDMALAQDAGKALWNTVSGYQSDTSNWLMFERGYQYEDMGRFIVRGSGGESEMHPLYVGAWGEGDKPEITEKFQIYQENSTNVVIQDLHFSAGANVIGSGHNIIFDNLLVTNTGMAIQGTSGITLRNSEFYDIQKEAPVNSGDTWHPHLNREGGIYVDKTTGLLLEGNFFDHIGWADDYRYDLSTEGGQPPSLYSHNIYLQHDNSDVTMRDSILMRGASFGAQIRSGGFVEDNLFLDNNAAINLFGGDYGGAGPVGEYTLMSDNVVTSGAHKTVADAQGALTYGIDNAAYMTSLVDNIVTHLADPNNPSELDDKIETHFALNNYRDPHYDDTVVYNWEAATVQAWKDNWRDKNIDGLDTNTLDQTTIQLFTAQLLGKPDATISDLADYLRSKADGAFEDVVDADLIIRFFQEGFGLAPDIRAEEGLLRFIPNDLGDGVRWDNRLNWSSQDLPGTQDGDSVDLGGNQVIYGGTTTIDELEFGAGGGLQLEHGKLTVEGGMETSPEGATLDINGAGQLWSEGARGEGVLDIDVTGGRFANTGNFQANSNLTASGGQTLLAVDDATYAVTNGSRLEVVGDDGKIGFDGAENGLAILGLGDEATLAFDVEDGALGTIEEFRSGALGDDTKVQSGADLGGSTLEIDLAGLAAGQSEFTLLSVDEMIGNFDAANITGLGNQDAEIIVDYETDTVRLKLTAGTGQTNMSTLGSVGDVSAGDQAVWNALTANQGNYDDALPAQDDDDYVVAA